jgi:hypothetical protein
MYVYIYIYIYKYTSIHIHIYIYSYTYIYKYRLCFLQENDQIWRVKFERVMTRGVANIELKFITFEIIIPTITWLLDFLLIPYFISRLICYFITSYTIQTIIVRYSFLVYFVLRITVFVSKKMYISLEALHNEMRDTRYLVGTELTNRTPNEVYI